MPSLMSLQRQAKLHQQRMAYYVQKAEQERQAFIALEAQIQQVQRGAWLFLIPSRLAGASRDDLQALRAYAESVLAEKAEKAESATE